MYNSPLATYNIPRRQRRGPRFKLLPGLFFFPLLWLRHLVQGLLRLLSGLCLIGGVIFCIIAIYNQHQHFHGRNFWLSGGALFAVSFFSFMAMYFYDSILIRLNPTDRTFFFY